MPEPLPNLAEYIEQRATTEPPPEDMPLPRAEIYVQAEAEDWGVMRRAVPDDFEEHVYRALEYTMRHQGLGVDECCRRRDATRAWMAELRQPGRYDEWCERENRRAGALLQASDERDQELRRAREAEKAAAEARADQLLKTQLTALQRKEYIAKGYFHVVVGERRFRITKGRSHNIKEVDARSRIRRTFCAHPIPNVPHPDTMLAQKLMLEARPEEFFKLANTMVHISGGRIAARRRRYEQAANRRALAYQERLFEGFRDERQLAVAAAARFDERRRTAVERIRQLQEETDRMARGEEFFVEPLVQPVHIERVHSRIDEEQAIATRQRLQEARDREAREEQELRRLQEAALDEAAGLIPEGVCRAVDELVADAEERGVRNQDERAA